MDSQRGFRLDRPILCFGVIASQCSLFTLWRPEFKDVTTEKMVSSLKKKKKSTPVDNNAIIVLKLNA